MAKKLFEEQPIGLISPLIDVVANGLGGMFIILMVYLAVARPLPLPPEPLKFLTEVEPPPAVRGQSYVFTFPVTGGTGERKFTVLKGKLSDLNLKFDPDTGTIYGVPDVRQTGGIGGSIRFPLELKIEVEVKDAKGNRDTRPATLTLDSGAIPYSDTPLEINRKTEILPLGRVGVAYEEVLGASGGVEPYVWQIVKGKLPPGLNFDRKVGRIDGTPSESGLFRFEVKVEHPSGTFVYKDKRYTWSSDAHKRDYQLEVLESLRHSLHLPVGRVGEPYFASVLTNSRLPGERISWTAAVDGLTPSDDDGSLRGTPSKPGIFKISYIVKGNGQNQLGTGSGNLRILPRSSPSVGPIVLQAWVGEAVRYAIPYRGMHEPVTVTALAPLPEGLRINNGQIVGVPAKTGMVTIPVKVKDALENVADGEVTIRIGSRRTPLTIEAPETIDLVVGGPVYWRPAVSGGEGDYDWELQGQLPPGLKFRNGAVEGELAVPGTWSVMVSIRDRITGETASRRISFRGVYAKGTKPRLLTTSIPNAIVGTPFEFTFAVAGGVGVPRFSFKGSLPKGLKFTDTGLLGIPTSAGISEFEVTVTDEVGQKDGPKRFYIQVEVIDRSQPRVVASTLPPAVPGHKYIQVFSAEGGIGRYTWEIRGKLPRGLRFTANGIEGTVDHRARGTFPIKASVSDEAGQSSTREFTLQVDVPR